MKIMRKSTGRSRFLPDGSLAIIRKMALKWTGFFLALLAVAMAVALITATATDPSWNTAVDGPVANLLGPFGAIIADLLLQWFGVAAGIPVLVALVWGLRYATTALPPQHWRLRLSALVPTSIAAAIALAFLPDWTELPAGSSGALGKVLQTTLAQLLPDELAWLPALIMGLLAVIGAFFSLGLSASEWGGLSRRSMDAVMATTQAASEVAGAIRRTADDIRVPPTEPFRHQYTRTESRREPPVFQPEPEDEDDDDQEAFPLTDEPPQVHGALVEPKRPPANPGKRDQVARQGSLDLGNPTFSGYEIPSLGLLSLTPEQGLPRLNQDGLAQNARMLETVLEDFGVNGKVVKVRPGPVVTLYELEPAPGTKTSRIIGLADDIARSMSALSVRIATIPGRNVMGIELPNSRREIVYLRELLACEQFEKANARLTLVLGKDISGAPVMVDLARMPHLLVAGTTGSGKSVAINTMILSLLSRLRPEECRIIMIDPKMLELSVYDGIPHLLAPVVTEPGKAVVALKWAVREMENRYRAMSQLGVRNIAGYNQRLSEAGAKGETLTRTVQTGFDPESGKPIYEEQTLALEPLPFIVVIVDEMADLMLVAGKEIEAAVQRLAQMARAAGIHIIMATQRPSVDVITGTIKANFPTRISFQVTSKIDSRTILGEQGAEQLLGQGDMLYMAAGGRITRVHGPFVSDDEVVAVVEHLRAQGEPLYVEAVTEEEETEAELGGGGGGSGDDLYDQAVALVAREGKASTSFVQRHLQIGYNRAARLIERMEAEGVVSKANHVGKREVLARSGREEY